MARNLGFHRGFNLTLERLSSALHCIGQNSTATHEQLGICMGVNTPVSKGFVAWLLHTGLITVQPSTNLGKSSYQYTDVGKLVQQYDPNLSNIGTQWILHYFLASEHSERSDAWYLFINQFLLPGQFFTSRQFKDYFANMMGASAENQKALAQDPTYALYTYTRIESLGRLGIIREQPDGYTCVRPSQPHSFVVAFVLLDWWKCHYDQTDTLRISQLCQEPGSIGRIFQANAQQVKQIVADLSQLGLLSFAETQHEPVNRLYREPPHTLLEMYYRQ